FSSGAALSWTVNDHRSANPARLINSSFRGHHAATFFHAWGVRSKRLKQRVSTIPQLSKSLAHRSICDSVTSAGSSTNDVSIRASYQPVSQSSRASSWFLPRGLATFWMFDIDTPNALFV